MRLRHLLTLLVATMTVVAMAVAVGPPADAAPAHGRRPAPYTNPMQLSLPGGFTAASCADPDVIRAGTTWYLYCTTDRASDDTDAPDIGLIPIYRSTDLVHWTYVRAALPAIPSYAAGGAGMWAPDINRVDGEYRLYFAVSNTSLPGGGSAIGVATADSPTGPFTVSQTPVVAPSDIPGNPGVRRSTIDPELVSDHGHDYLFYGGFGGGLLSRTLSADGLHTDASSQRRIAIDNRYEGAKVVRHGGWWYLMASSTNCCNGPLTGYTVFAARSRHVLGPYLDRDGRSVLDSLVGGTPVVAQNGNRWVGVGHNTVVTDFAGQDWMIYHGIDRHDPYYAGAEGYTKRPGLIDPIDWIHGWPEVNAGAGPSDRPHAGPVAQPGEQPTYRPHSVRDPQPGHLIRSLSDEFSGHALGRQWSWVRTPDPSTYAVSDGTLAWDTQAGDLHPPTDNLPAVLTEPAPHGAYMVQIKIKMSTPPTGCCQNYVQGGLVAYNDDGHYIKLASVSMWDTRQVEIGKNVYPQQTGYPTYGNGVVGPVGRTWTYLRLVREPAGQVDHYTAYSSIDGRQWDKGATWTQQASDHTKIGLISMAGAGFTSTFDYVRVYRLRR